jgi:hypothetical protein
MKKLLTALVALTILLIPSTANAACGNVRPGEFREVHTTATRWHTEHQVVHATGEVTKRWTDDNGYRHQVRTYHSSVFGSQVRIAYLRLSSDTAWLVTNKQWCNLNSGPSSDETSTAQWICKAHVWDYPMSGPVLVATN